MRYNTSWNALLKPGESQTWLEAAHRIRAFEHGSSYDPALAWLLSEVSRLAYKDLTHDTPMLARLKNLGLSLKAQVDKESLSAQLWTYASSKQATFSILAFRGTLELQNWITNLHTLTSAWNGEDSLVHRGFKTAFDSLWPRVKSHMDTCPHPRYYTGHSLGAALATLAAATHPPQALYTYGSPRVGNGAFAQHVESATPAFRLVNHRDIVTTLPWENQLSPFDHIGELHYIDHQGQRQVNPSSLNVFWAKLKQSITWKDAFNARQFVTPVKTLSDHSPINYSYALEQDLQN